MSDARTTPALRRAQRWIAGTIAALVVLLAVLAGRFLFLGESIIELHGYIGNGLFFLTLVNLALVFRTTSHGPTVAVAGLIALLAFAQVGLGYVGRETADAAALHVPNGVLLMGLSAYHFGESRNRTAVPGR